MWRLHEESEGRSKEENALELKSRLEKLVGVIPNICSLEVGINVTELGASSDVVLYSDFADWEALEQYRKHPQHLALIEFLDGVRSEMRVVDYEVQDVKS